MKIFFSDHHSFPLPDGHRFPLEKYALLRRMLLEEGVLSRDQLHPAPLCTKADLLLAHDSDYVTAFLDGSLDPKALRRIGLPWSSAYVTRVLASVGGTLAATQEALETGFSGQLAGGTHHAHAGFGSGFCVFNDFAVAALKALSEGWVHRIAIVDLDVHQGDGNAAILTARPDVFVFSLHGDKNFPFRKVASDLDVALPDGTGDVRYLEALEQALPRVLAFKPDLVLYQAGVDPLAADKLGRFDLSHEGLMARDRQVLSACHARGIPLVMTMGGGYCDPITPSVQAYANSYRVAVDVFAAAPGPRDPLREERQVI
ncbi:histone deacetylase family protein [Rhodovibrionaceae bacterium A322]